MSENPILEKLTYDKSSGALLYKGVRYLLIRPETIAGFQKALARSCGPETGEKLFAGGYSGGRLSSKKYRALHRLANRELVEFMMNMGSQIGWGRFRLDRYDPAGKCLHVSVAHSPFAESYGPSPHGVCHLIRGILAGMAALIFETECTSEETQCRAKGDQSCLFVVEAKG
jgi:predicted hydrocarbon binding protein